MTSNKQLQDLLDQVAAGTVGAADAKRVAKLVADLDSADFATRERAARELGEIGPPAAAALREALKKSESAESSDVLNLLHGLPG